MDDQKNISSKAAYCKQWRQNQKLFIDNQTEEINKLKEEIQSLKDKHHEEVMQLTKKHEEEVEKLTKKHEQEVMRLNRNHEEVKRLQEQVMETTTALYKERLERKETNQQVEPEPVAADDFKFMKKFEGIPEGLDMIKLCNDLVHYAKTTKNNEKETSISYICGQRIMFPAGEDTVEQAGVLTILEEMENRQLPLYQTLLKNWKKYQEDQNINLSSQYLICNGWDFPSDEQSQSQTPHCDSASETQIFLAFDACQSTKVFKGETWKTKEDFQRYYSHHKETIIQPKEQYWKKMLKAAPSLMKPMVEIAQSMSPISQSNILKGEVWSLKSNVLHAGPRTTGQRVVLFGVDGRNYSGDTQAKPWVAKEACGLWFEGLLDRIVACILGWDPQAYDNQHEETHAQNAQNLVKLAFLEFRKAYVKFNDYFSNADVDCLEEQHREYLEQSLYGFCDSIIRRKKSVKKRH